ncbi:ParB/RepB/Spo0J family partition protein [Streptomyces sp. NPDC006552]|uniref:ParB/RepB/Spo0J family partition protein n=1 Tax=Streptomyces sp. NPDC006552 TaxID=3157179 RepID=UPI0033AC48D3
MSVADKVGAPTISRRRRSDRGQAKAIAEGTIPDYELVKLRLEQVSPTPLNPRRNFGSDEEMTRFGEELREVQLAACVAVTRDAYLKLWPEHGSKLKDDAEYVLVNGERRFRSAGHVGLEKLDFVVRDELASSREDFVDHLLAENLDREDFDVIERARGVEQLVNICAEEGGERGARSRAAKRLGKDRSWVTNQLALLTLPTEIQARLSAGEISERDGRTLARHLKEDPSQGSAELLAHLEVAKQSAERQKAEEQRLLAAGREALSQGASGELLSADNNSQEPTGPSTDSGSASTGGPAPASSLLSADNNPPTVPAPSSPSGADHMDSSADAATEQVAIDRRDGASENVPVPRRQQSEATSASPQVTTGVKFPYDNAAKAAGFLDERMDDEQFLRLVDIVNDIAERRRATAAATAK